MNIYKEKDIISIQIQKKKKIRLLSTTIASQKGHTQLDKLTILFSQAFRILVMGCVVSSSNSIEMRGHIIGYEWDKWKKVSIDEMAAKNVND